MTQSPRSHAVLPRGFRGILGLRPMAAVAATLVLIGVTAAAGPRVVTVPVLWTAGGLSAGTFSAGQAARMASDASGNVAIVSGPSDGSLLAITSYTADGALRWQRKLSPSQGTFIGDWVVAASDGDFVVVAHNATASGNPIALTLVRYDADGILLWRVDLARILPSVGRLVVDAAGDAYLAFNSVGDGQDIELHKYSSSGVLLWSKVIATGAFANEVASSLALSPDGTDVVVTGSIVGGATWITAAYDTATGTRRWLVTAAEGIAARDVVVDDARVYVAGQGNVGTTGFLRVVAYDRATGARLWRTDKKPADASNAAALRMDRAPDGSLVVAGQASRGFLDWYTVALETSGALRWEAVRDGGLNTDEIPRGVLVMADGTTVVTGPGGPNLPGGFIQGVTAGYSPDGTLLWEAFSRLATVWATALPNGEDVCATGGYDALVTCWRVSDVVSNQPPTAVMTATPSSGTAPLTVSFDGSLSTDPDGTVSSWDWSFGDGSSGTGPAITHLYSTPGTFTASLTVTDDGGASSTTTGSIVVNPLLPPAPSGLTATSLKGFSIGLKWTNGSTGQTSVLIERCKGSGCTNFSQVAAAAGSATTFIDAGLSAGTYRYRVRAYTPLGYSPYSNVASARSKR